MKIHRTNKDTVSDLTQMVNKSSQFVLISVFLFNSTSKQRVTVSAKRIPFLKWGIVPFSRKAVKSRMICDYHLCLLRCFSQIILHFLRKDTALCVIKPLCWRRTKEYCIKLKNSRGKKIGKYDVLFWQKLLTCRITKCIANRHSTLCQKVFVTERQLQISTNWYSNKNWELLLKNKMQYRRPLSPKRFSKKNLHLLFLSVISQNNFSA